MCLCDVVEPEGGRADLGQPLLKHENLLLFLGCLLLCTGRLGLEGVDLVLNLLCVVLVRQHELLLLDREGSLETVVHVRDDFIELFDVLSDEFGPTGLLGPIVDYLDVQLLLRTSAP